MKQVHRHAFGRAGVILRRSGGDDRLSGRLYTRGEFHQSVVVTHGVTKKRRPSLPCSVV